MTWICKNRGATIRNRATVGATPAAQLVAAQGRKAALAFDAVAGAVTSVVDHADGDLVIHVGECQHFADHAFGTIVVHLADFGTHATQAVQTAAAIFIIQLVGIVVRVAFGARRQGALVVTFATEIRQSGVDADGAGLTFGAIHGGVAFADSGNQAILVATGDHHAFDGGLRIFTPLAVGAVGVDGAGLAADGLGVGIRAAQARGADVTSRVGSAGAGSATIAFAVAALIAIDDLQAEEVA